jgi:hypothetical protein
LLLPIFIRDILKSYFQNLDWIVELLLAAVGFALIKIFFLGRLRIIGVLQALL